MLATKAAKSVYSAGPKMKVQKMVMKTPKKPLKLRTSAPLLVGGKKPRKRLPRTGMQMLKSATARF